MPTSTFEGLTSRCKTWRSWACSHRLGQTCAPPGNRLRIGPADEGPAARVTLGRRGVLWLKAIEQVQQIGTGAGGSEIGMIQDLKKCYAAQIRHAEQMKVGRRVGSVGVDGHDVSVLEARQRLRLAGTGAGDFQGDGAIGEVLLFSEVDAGERTAAELFDESKSADCLAGLGERCAVAAVRRVLPCRVPALAARGFQGLRETNRRCRENAPGNRRASVTRRPLREG